MRARPVSAQETMRQSSVTAFPPAASENRVCRAGFFSRLSSVTVTLSDAASYRFSRDSRVSSPPSAGTTAYRCTSLSNWASAAWVTAPWDVAPLKEQSTWRAKRFSSPSASAPTSSTQITTNTVSTTEKPPQRSLRLFFKLFSHVLMFLMLRSTAGRPAPARSKTASRP